MTTRLLITVPDVQDNTPHSVFVINPITEQFEPVASNTLHILDVYECKPNTRGGYLPKKYKLTKRRKFASYFQALSKARDLVARQAKEKKTNKFIMWSQSEAGADLCFKDFVKENIPVKDFLYFDQRVFRLVQEVAKSKAAKTEEEANAKAEVMGVIVGEETLM